LGLLILFARIICILILEDDHCRPQEQPRKQKSQQGGLQKQLPPPEMGQEEEESNHDSHAKKVLAVVEVPEPAWVHQTYPLGWTWHPVKHYYPLQTSDFDKKSPHLQKTQCNQKTNEKVKMEKLVHSQAGSSHPWSSYQAQDNGTLEVKVKDLLLGH
jgi:hypothetical protein